MTGWSSGAFSRFEHMGRTSYREEYLRSAHWKRLRRVAAEKLPKVCPCGARTGLDLHHMTYERLGHERLDDVAWLCRPCHEALHREDSGGALFSRDRARQFSRPTPASRESERQAHAARVRAVEDAKRKAKRAGDYERAQAIVAFAKQAGLSY